MDHNGNSENTQSLRVIITGGAKGIGKACVETFASHGHNVLFTYISSEIEAHRIASNEKWYGRVKALRSNQGDFEQLKLLKSEVDLWRENRPIDVLIHNAAVGSATVTSFMSHTGEAVTEEYNAFKEDEAFMTVNALGPLWLTQTLLPLLQVNKNRSVVIFIGSVGGGSQSVFPGFRPADGMSKAAIGYLAKLLAAEHAHSSIDFICLNPGAVETDMFRASTLDKMTEQQKLNFIANFPKKRLIQPQEIADSVYWLATNQSARIFNGACLDASQGLAVRPGLLTEYKDI